MIAEVIINRSAQNINRLFDYNIPKEFEGNISLGTRVIVPFGRGKNNNVEGYVLSLKETSSFDVSILKSIIKVLDKESILNENKIELAKWMSKKYFCNLSDCLNCIVPPGTISIKNKKEKRLLKRQSITIIKSTVHIDTDKDLTKTQRERFINVLNILNELNKCNSKIYLDYIVKEYKITKNIIKSMIDKGYIFLSEEIVYRTPYNISNIKCTQKFIPNKEQKDIIDNINKLIGKRKFSESLIYGVTGSGKTEIYMQCIESCLDKGLSSIVLVPEISLTNQLINRFVGRFGEKIAVLHSKLSDGERYDQWHRILNKDARIVIGARSAIFAPVDNLGAIIIDEEHDSSYRSNNTPRYSTQEVARYICNQKGSSLILGSATPNIVTYYKANQGIINLFKIVSRANNASMPNIEIVDLREELANGNRSMFSDKLKCEIENNIANKEQTIIFINRRAHSSFVMCRDCGFVPKCKNCNISLHYHNNDKLVCHYCNYRQNSYSICPVCGSKNIRYFGVGTQKVEEELKKVFPNASIMRMDADTTSKKNSIKEILEEFQNNNINILVGTKMIAKRT